MSTPTFGRYYTVWEVRGVTFPEKKRIVRLAHADDHTSQHEYQRVVWTGHAFGENDALKEATLAAR